MKRTLILCYAFLFAISSFANSPRNIDEKLVQSFQANFPRAEKVSWQELSDLYVVSFTDNGILSRIMYQKKNGSIASYFRYYLQESLPLSIRMSVQHRYAGKKIQGVVEISTPVVNEDGSVDTVLTTLYYVKLEGPNNWTTVKVDGEGNCEVVEKFKKAL